MEIKPRKLKGTFEITLNRIGDARGYFMRTYSQEVFAEHGLQIDWVQENQSLSARPHTIRGLHFQLPPFTETKLVRVVRGAMLDYFVDLRRDSETYGQWDSIELSADNDKVVYIPKGFAHGFRTLTENVITEYKIDVAYQAESASGIRWNDETLNINWDVENPIISERDAQLGFFKNFDSPFKIES